MILIKAQLPSGLKRVSNNPTALDHYWDGDVASFDPVAYSISNPYGGYVAPQFGSISFLPNVFEDDWPPPVTFDIEALYTDTTESAATTMFSGTGYLARISRETIEYDLYGPTLTGTLSGIAFTETTLSGIFADGCDDLNLTLDKTLIRSTASMPNITYGVSGEERWIDLLDTVAAYFTHYFFIEDNTLYLCDMFKANGSGTLTEFDYFPSQYNYNTPTKSVAASGTKAYSEYTYGSEIDLNPVVTTSGYTTIVNNILTLSNKMQTRVVLPLSDSIPAIGSTITLTDTSLGPEGEELSIELKVRGLDYNIDNDEYIITGECTYSG